jgi:hypothetical protein
MTDFLKENNVRLLWEVLMDADILRSKPKEFIEYILHIFQKNLIPFYENERRITQNLVLFNKKYISLIMDMIVQLESNSKNVNKTSKLQIVEKKDLITYEEIKEERKSVFEREFNKKQEEFQRAVTLPTPPLPKFGDKVEEEKPPISELERRIQQTMKERNFDLENRNYLSTDIKNPSDWLNPQETSVKKEKIMVHSNSIENKIKYIKIEEPLIKENIIQPIQLDGLETCEGKHIQWKENLEESYYIPNIERPTDDIFSKLKTIPSIKNEETNYLLKDIRIQQLEEEMQILYQKIDDISSTMEEIKKMITLNKINIEK